MTAHVSRARCHVTLGLLFALVGCASATIAHRGARVNVFAQPLRSQRTPARVINFASVPLCGSRGPQLVPFSTETVSYTAYRAHVLTDEVSVVACSVEITGAVWRAYESLAVAEYRAVLDLDGLAVTDAATGKDGYTVAKPLPLRVAAHMDFVVLFTNVSHGDGNAVEIVGWLAKPAYAIVEPGPLAFTYSVSWRPAPPGTKRERAPRSFSDTVVSLQFASVLVCIGVTIVLSCGIVATVRQFVSPFLSPGGSLFARQLGPAADGAADGEEAGLLYGDAAGAPPAASASNWRTLADDVFRPPRHVHALIVGTATGAHAFAAVVACLLFASLGLHTQLHLLAWVLTLATSAVGGIVAESLHAKFRCRAPTRVAAGTALLLPCLTTFVTLVANGVLAAQSSVRAAPAPTLIGMLLVWTALCCAVSLMAFTGRYRLSPVSAPAFRGRARASHRDPLPHPPASAGDIGVRASQTGFYFVGIAAPVFVLVTSIYTARVIQISGAFALTLLALLAWATLVCSISIAYTFYFVQKGAWAWTAPAFVTGAATGVPVLVMSGVYYAEGNFLGAASALFFACVTSAAAVVVSLSAAALSVLSASYFIHALYSHARAD